MSSPDADIDRLYQGPLDQFTAARNQLSASLKKAGDKAGAERVKALVKPSVTAWVLNQVWWRDQARVRALVEAGAAQRRALIDSAQGRGADVRDADEARQRASALVLEAAFEILGGRHAVAPDVQYRLAGSVEALASAGVPPDTRPGRWTRDLQASGLDALAALAVAAPARPMLVDAPVPSTAALSSPAPLPTPDVSSARASGRAQAARDKGPQAAEAAARARAEQMAQAQARVAAMSAALDAAAAAAGQAAEGERAARERLETAVARRADLEAALDEARAAEAAARRDVSQAATTASRTELDRARAARDLARAREALEVLQKTR